MDSSNNIYTPMTTSVPMPQPNYHVCPHCGRCPLCGQPKPVEVVNPVWWRWVPPVYAYTVC